MLLYTVTPKTFNLKTKAILAIHIDKKVFEG